MNKASVIRTAAYILDTYGSADPDAICRQEGILLLYAQMGREDFACKGFILQFEGKTAITINSDLDEELQHIIKVHELSHYFLHIATGSAEAFHDFSAFDEASIEEYEANLLTAELLLRDEDIDELIDEGCDFYEMASRLSVPAELLDFKLRLMREKGAVIAEAPIASLGTFMQRL
ncbi:MAG TPA: ImmA/IrrE family metallo-endopeptidase [Candidatus Avilachnospira avistercoris]|nr:ImmA/IrrE family metallo-endopeptidase [Candidatus Avilachnospira avistercoris]